jgi:Carboxypeptidase regulatory-like domain
MTIMHRMQRPTRARPLFLGLISLFPAAMLPAQNAPSAQARAATGVFRVAGTVVNSLDASPLGKARVSLADVRNPSKAISVVTAEDGRFEFAQLPSGKFVLSGAKRGFHDASYQQHGPYSTAIVTGDGIDAGELVLRLTPLATISGKIFDESGEPVRDAQVKLYGKGAGSGLQQEVTIDSSSTDDAGSYEFTPLPPGTYVLGVSARPWYAVHPPLLQYGSAPKTPTAVDRSLDVAYPATFYDGASNSDGATPIRMKGGERLQIDVHLNPVAALHIFVHIAPPADYSQGYSIPQLMRHDFDSIEFVGSDAFLPVAPGVFEMGGLPPGKYSLLDQQDKSGFQYEVNVQENGQDFNAPAAERFGSVTFTLKLPGDGPPLGGLFLRLINSQRRIVAQLADAISGVTFNEISPGKYSVIAMTETQPYNIVRTISQGQEISGGEVTIAAGQSQEATIYLTTGAVGVEGFVKRSGKPVPGAMVVLVPRDEQSRPEFYRRDQSDLDGSFVVREVFPGTYTLVAIDNGWDLAWREPGALTKYLAQGQVLTIGESMQGMVRLPQDLQTTK